MPKMEAAIYVEPGRIVLDEKPIRISTRSMGVPKVALTP